MKTPEEILQPFVEKIFRHTEVVEKDNALLAMQKYADEVRLPINMGWISFEDQKPNNYEAVLYWDAVDKSINIGYFVHPTYDKYKTHWMRLPAQP